MTIQHTSQTEIGQIYLPGSKPDARPCLRVMLVLGFRSSDNLASAYGIAVTGTMTITTMLFCNVARDRWHWSGGRWSHCGALFLVVDLSFLAANLVKIAKGGWFPLVVAARGLSADDHLEARAWHSHRHPAGEFAADARSSRGHRRRKPPRVPGTAVFMTSDPGGAPAVLLHHLKHNKVLHEKVIIMSIEGEGDSPGASREERVEFKELGEGFYQVVGALRIHGVTRHAGVCWHSLGPQGLESQADGDDLLSGPGDVDPDRPLPAGPLAQEALHPDDPERPSATAFFGLPPNRVVELGAQIQF